MIEISPLRFSKAVQHLVALAVLMAPLNAWSQQPDLIVSGNEVHVKVFATLPSNMNGDTARINAITRNGDRLFAVEALNGRVWDVTNGGNAVLWFDVAAAFTTALGSNNGIDFSNTFHGGLRSVAFHPQFASNRKLYTSQMVIRTGGGTYLSDSLNPINADSTVAEWTVDATGSVDVNSYREVLRVGLPNYDHPIKQIAFNNAASPGDEDYGLLYIGHGDGSVGDSFGSGQENDALGKVLRINPLASNGTAYTVPGNNPFVENSSMLDEVYSIGHRNPHSLAFAQDGTLIVADAGRDNAEEVNLIQAGGDYGWSQREGTFVHIQTPTGGFLTGVDPLPANDADFGFIYPAAQFGHEGSAGQVFTQHSIIGGYVVENGSALSGQYLYGEFTQQGEIYHSALRELQSAVTQGAPAALTQAPTRRGQIRFDHDNNDATAMQVKQSMLDVIDDSPMYDSSGRSDLRFGQGADGEVYVSSKRNNTIYLIINSVKPNDPPMNGDALTIITTPDKVPSGNYGWVKYSDNTKQWIDSVCRDRLSIAGVQLESKEWAEISAYADTSTPLSCDAIIALTNEPSNDTTRIVTTPDKASLPNYGWAVFASGSKQWIDETCRSTLTTQGLSTELLSWNEISAIPDGIAIPCDQIGTPTMTTLSIVVTPDRIASGNYGWVVFSDNTKQWIPGSCRTQLEAQGIQTTASDWPNIDSIPDSTNYQDCASIGQ